MTCSFDELRSPILDLKCRFIHGDPADPYHRYCGAPTRLGSSWCDVHARLVYLPPEQRRMRRAS
jgi:hypothetical protein